MLETAKVRVFTLPRGSVKLPHEQGIAGAPVLGCLKATGKARLLDTPGQKRAFWLGVDPHALAASGPLVAYAFTQYYLDTHETWVRVLNLRSGELIRSCLAGPGRAPRRLPHVVKIVMTSRGAVAWSSQGSPEGSEAGVIVACDSLEPRVLDEGDGIDLESLSLKRSVIRWLDEGGGNSAALK